MGVFRIALCEDEAPQAALLEDWVRAWASERGRAITLASYPSAEALLFAREEVPMPDLLLLDIQMPGMDGLTLARQLRAEDPSLAIVFITGLAEHMQVGFEVSALHYLLKPLDKAQLFACLDRAAQQTQRTEPVLLLRGAEGTRRLMQRDILYIEAFAHTVAVHAVAGVYEAALSIGTCWAQLEAALFVRPHRSYIVGIRHIHAITKGSLTLEDGTSLPVSRRQYEETNRAFLRFYTRGDA